MQTLTGMANEQLTDSSPSQGDGVQAAFELAASALKVPHPTDPYRWADGTVRLGNPLARKSGIYAKVTRTGAKLAAYQDWASVYGGVQALTHEMSVVLWELADTVTLSESAQDYIENSAESLVSSRKQKAIATKNRQQDQLARLIPLLHSLAAKRDAAKHLDVSPEEYARQQQQQEQER